MNSKWLHIDKATIFNSKDENGNRYLSQFLKEYQDTFNPDIINAGFEKCLNDYYYKFIKHLSRMKKTKNDSGYKLKAKYDGIPLEFGSRILVTNQNITKEYGDKLLEDHPKGEDLFDQIPEVEEKVININSLKRPELDERAQQLGLDPKNYKDKASIIQAISEVEEEGNTGLNNNDEEE